MARDRQILEDAVASIAKAAANASDVVDEAAEVLDAADPLVVHSKMLRLELLEVKAAREGAG
jgi:hypothetical protein